MTAQTITITGVRGGSGTTTALLLSGHAGTELAAAERDTTGSRLWPIGIYWDAFPDV